MELPNAMSKPDDDLNPEIGERFIARPIAPGQDSARKPGRGNEKPPPAKKKPPPAKGKPAPSKEKAPAARDKAALAKEKAALAKEKAALAKEKAALAKEKAALAKEKAAERKPDDDLNPEIGDRFIARPIASGQESARKPAPAKEKPALVNEKAAPGNEKAAPGKEKAAPAREKPAPTKEKAAPAKEKRTLAKEKVALAEEKAVRAEEEKAEATPDDDLKPEIGDRFIARPIAPDLEGAQKPRPAEEKAAPAKEKAALAKEKPAPAKEESAPAKEPARAEGKKAEATPDENLFPEIGDRFIARPIAPDLEGADEPRRAEEKAAPAEEKPGRAERRPHSLALMLGRGKRRREPQRGTDSIGHTYPLEWIRQWGVAIPALVLAVLLTAIASSWATASPEPPYGGGEPFISASGAHLMTGEQEWEPVGFNDYRLTSSEGGYVCDPSQGEVGEEQLGRRLDDIQASGGNVVRTWFFQPGWDADGSGSGDWGAFDRVLAAAAERDLRVIPVLTNHWADCLAGAPDKDYDFYAGGFRAPFGGAALAYIDYVKLVVARYASSPTVAFWQLANEPEARQDAGCDEAAASDALAGFAQETSTAIRAIDGNHLIGLGAIGGKQCGSAGSNYAQIHESVDICGVHAYGAASEPNLDSRAADCEAAGKPIVADEVGIEADVDESGSRTGEVTESSLANRAVLLRARLDSMLAAGLDGFLLWQLSPEQADHVTSPLAVGPCDPALTVTRDLGSVGAPTLPAGCDEGGG